MEPNFRGSPGLFQATDLLCRTPLAVGDLELAEDVGDMVLDGLEAEDKFPGYVGVGPPGKQSCPTLLADLLD